MGKPRVVALSNGIRDIINLQIQWATLSAVERRTATAKLMALNTVEMAAFFVATFASGGSAGDGTVSGNTRDLEENDNSKKDKKDKKDKKKDGEKSSPV